MSDTAEATGDQSNGSVVDPPVNTEKSDERLAYRGVFQRLLIRPEIGAIIGAAAIWVFFWAVTGVFGQAGGILPVLAVASTLGIMAVAVSLLMIGGEFDLSSGAATGTLGIVTILLVKDAGELGGAGLSLYIALPLSLVVALGIGWTNGVVVEKTGLPSFIVTLAMFFVLRGFKLGFSKKIIDNISVGRIDEGHGYDFFVKIFGSTWSRNDHVWDLRDGFYSVFVIGGITLLVLSVYEYSYQRRATFNPAGLMAFLAGIAGAGFGFALLHATDGVGANWVAGIVFAVSGVVGFVGLGAWRYERREAGEVKLSGNVLRLLIGGVVSVFLGMLAAWGLDLDSQQTVLDLLSWASWPLVVAAGVVGGWLALRREGEHITASRELMLQGVIRVGWIALLSAFGTYAFMFMTTEQGLRAIMLAVLVIAGVMALGSAALQAGRVSPATRTFVLLATSASIVVLAFFVRWQSSTPKFRTQAFTVMLVGALMVGCWALVSGGFKQRRRDDARADHLATILGVVGLVAVVSGVLIRLLFTTQIEIANGIAPAQFRVEFLWFVGVTILATLVLGKTKFGSWIFAVGGNKQAARQIGVPAARTKTQLFMIVTVAAWLVGLLLAFRLNTIQSGTGNGLEFEYIIAAVVGGTLLTGGYGSAFGAAIGAFIMAMARQGIPA
ncbi:MAG: ABC transporter permease, partial [Actinobacteria bacterium]|nr:ABC transporter permease [Actinomycetota bacterium]